MKKILFILILNISFIYGQGNLQFNQVISTTVSGTIEATPDLDGTLLGTITVPVGKVLKLESVSVYLNDSTGDIETYTVQQGAGREYDTWCLIGNHLVWAPYIYTSVGSTNFDKFVQTSNFPIWLNAGTHEVRVRYNTTFGAGTYTIVSYSAIEFNII